MVESADRRLVTLTMDGAEEHQGHVMARALVDKLDRFLKTFASFERAYIGANRRQTDFEIVRVSHNSPTEFGLNPVPRVKNYIPSATVAWTFEQWEKIVIGVKPDAVVDEDMIGDVADLAESTERLGYTDFFVKFDGRKITFDDTAVFNAKKLQTEMQAQKITMPWRSGQTRGTIVGELRSVLDADSEKQIVVCPFFGPARVRCSFKDDMKELIRQYLWGIVKIHGVMQYGAGSPHPISVDIDTIRAVSLDDSAPHLLDGYGLFKDSAYATWVAGDLDV